MESLAYLEIALAHEQPETNYLNTTQEFRHLTFLNLSRGIQCSFLVLAVLLGCLGTTTEVLAQRVLKLGVTDPEVMEVQRRLRTLGLFDQPLSNYYGIYTQNAVIRFQSLSGLDPDGVVGASTRARLFNYSPSQSLSTNLPLPPPVPPSGRSSFPQTERVYTAPATPVVSGEVTRTLREGDRGQDVRLLQQRLQQQGVYTGLIDGVYGENTEQAVRVFQIRRGLGVDGVAGRETLTALGLTSQPGIRTEDLPYIVVIPDPNGGLLFRVQRVFRQAFLADSRRGQYIHAGSFSDYETAASQSYALRAEGFDARVVHF